MRDRWRAPTRKPTRPTIPISVYSDAIRKFAATYEAKLEVTRWPRSRVCQREVRAVYLAVSRAGGEPNWREYSRLNCEVLL